MLLVTAVTSFSSSGGLMCLGKTMCSSKNSGKKKETKDLFRMAGLWNGLYGPDNQLILRKPSYKNYKRNLDIFKTK